jgi:uncharacterized iron-regulated protein
MLRRLCLVLRTALNVSCMYFDIAGLTEPKRVIYCHRPVRHRITQDGSTRSALVLLTCGARWSTRANLMRSSFVALVGFSLVGCMTDHMTNHLMTNQRIESPYRDPTSLAKGQILHVATGRLLTKAELIEYLTYYPVVYVGESHDSVDDHAVQLEILKGLAERFPGRVAVGMEMLRRPSQAEVDAYIRGDMGEKDFLRVWHRNWSDTFAYYRDILHYARQHRVPILALNAAKDLRIAISEKGPDNLDPAMAARLPDMDLDDPYHRTVIESIFAEHTKVTEHVEAFYRSQVLWDETMAQTAADYLTSLAGRDKHLLVFAGGYHVRYGFGIPRRLFRRVPLPYAIVDPYAVEVPEDKLEALMDVELPDLPMRAADIYWAVGYEDLEAQRIRLGIRIESAAAGGVRVLQVVPGSSAAKAGIEVGDVIVAVDGVSIGETFDLTYQIGLHRPGDTGQVEVLRNGQRLALPVTYEAARHGQ